MPIMPSICFYFQMHQPRRLRRYSVFDIGEDYFDRPRNSLLLERITEKCYLPTTRLLLELVEKLHGEFRFAYCITGILLEQLEREAPEVIELLQKLAKTGCVEFLSETYHHSLAFLYSRDEFKAQVQAHQQKIENLFGQSPTVFRNTELTYNNEMAQYIATFGRYHGILAEGADHVLKGRTPNVLYRPKGMPPDHHQPLKLLLKNYRLSDDIAFRFSNTAWTEYPLTARKFAGWIEQINEDHRPDDSVPIASSLSSGQVCNLFMDYETFGEHQWEETGIFDFLRELPEVILNGPPTANDFRTPSQCIQSFDAVDEFDAPHMISWADTERDLSAWIGNAMQSNALHELYKLERPIKESGDDRLLADWRALTASDHFYYMCTKYFADGDVHKYFNPYESPYDSYINFMNVLDNLRSRVDAPSAEPV